jgi:hypothetical protein
MANTRPWPKHFETYLKIANDHNMTFPRGRALYVCNRIRNGDWPHPTDSRTSPEHLKACGYVRNPELMANAMSRVVESMKKIRVETASRWFEHWTSGGHIKVMNRSIEEQNKFRREREKRHV